MNKLFTKIASLSVGLALAVGVGVAVGGRENAKAVKASESVAYTLSGTTTYTSTSYNGENDVTQNDVAWKVNGNVNQNPWRIGGNKNNGLESAGAVRHIQSQAAVSTENITKVVITSAKPSKNSISPTDITLKVGTAAGGSQTSSLSNGSWSASATFNRPNNADWSSSFFEIDFTMPENNTTTNKFINLVSVVFYYESSAALQNITLSSSSVNGYIEGATFNKTSFLATGVSVTAHYDNIDDVVVTNEVEVASTVLEVGNNSVTISYGGKDATLTVVAISQDAADTQAANEVIELINAVDATKSGNLFVDPLNSALTAYSKLNDNAKSKVSNYSDLQSIVNANSNYVIFNNSLDADNGTDIFKDGVKGTIPGTWLIPSSIDITDGAALYNGANSAAKIGKSGDSGSVTLSLTDSSKIFSKIRISVSKFGTDTGNVSISNVATGIVPPNETELYDVESQKINSVTISTSAKRAYINYVYFEAVANEDTLDSTIASSGTLTKTSYIDGQSFDPSGLTFTVTYNGGQSPKEITNISWSPNPLTAGTTSVTGTYIEGEQSATITISGLTVASYVTKTYGFVGQELADYSGTYYFYNDNSQRIWNATIPEATYSSIEANVANNTITSNINLDNGQVIISKVDGGYTLRNFNGEYIGPAATLSTDVANAVVVSEPSVHQIVSIGNDGVVTISAIQGENTTVYLRFNSQNNQLKARYYMDETKVKGMSMFKADASPVKSNYQLLDEFVENYMHPEISYSNNDDTNACRSEGEGAESYYDTASAAFNDLDGTLRELFANDDRYANPCARLEAWALANKEALDENYSLSAARMSFEIEDNNTMIIIIAIASLSAISISALLLIKKRKTNR